MTTSSARQPGSTIEAALRGERWAEESLVQLIRGFARHVCAHGAGAAIPDLDWEDVAQEASRRFFAVGLGRFRAGGPEKGYVYAYVRHAYLHLARGAWRRRQREEASEPPSAGNANPETRTLLHRILSRLSKECQELLQRLYFDGATYAELAQELGLADSSVRARTSRCLGRARKLVS